jgi:hypothetical protein
MTCRQREGRMLVLWISLMQQAKALMPGSVPGAQK